MEPIIPKRAVIYCRVSTKEQVDEGGSLATQEKICKDYAIKNGYTVAEIFIEEGESAKTAKRTQLRKMQDFCTSKKNRISAVIVYKVDRLARNIDDYRQIRLGLTSHGIDIKSTSEYFEDTPAGRFMENIIANVAQFDNDVRTERSVNGMKDAIREGRFTWYAPIGYRNVKIGGKSNIEKNHMAPIVKKAFEEVAANVKPVYEVWRQMLKEGLVNRKGKPVSASYFYSMLVNELYMGWIVGLGERQKGIFEPIISEDLFEQVQRVLKRRKYRTTQYKRDNEDFPLRRFISHPTGKKLTGCWSRGRNKKYPYYLFHIKGLEFKKDTLNTAFLNYYDEFKLSDEQAEKFRQKVRENLIKATSERQKERRLAEKYIADLKLRQKAIIQKNLEGVISDAILRDQLELIEEEMTKISATIVSIPSTATDYEKCLPYVIDFLKKPSSLWVKAHLMGRLKLQWFNFPKGITFDGEEFRTAEVCNLFKGEKLFSAQNSYRVPPTLSSSNHTATPKDVFWENIGKEITDLAAIIQEIQANKEQPTKTPTTPN